jgi:hypothetical protein
VHQHLLGLLAVELTTEHHMPHVLQVRVLVPDSKGGRIEVAILGRGQFVGERSVINDKLRSADCVAQGRVQVRQSPLSVCCLDLAGLFPICQQLKQE